MPNTFRFALIASVTSLNALGTAVGTAQAGDEELLIGRTTAGRMIVQVEIPQPLVLDASVFPGINGYATGAYGFATSVIDLPEDDLYSLAPNAEVRARLTGADPGVMVLDGGQPLQIGSSMAFGTPPFDYHPIFNITGGAPGQFRTLKFVIYEAAGLYAESEEISVVFTPAGCPADVGRQGGLPGADGELDNNDFIAFIGAFFNADSIADRGAQGGEPGTDGELDNNDFIVFISQFFAGC